MAYCRFSNGDVYIYHHIKGHLECCGCRLPGYNNTCFTTKYRERMLEHIQAHKRIGHKVGRGAISRLKREIIEIGDIVK